MLILRWNFLFKNNLVKANWYKQTGQPAEPVPPRKTAMLKAGSQKHVLSLNEIFSKFFLETGSNFPSLYPEVQLAASVYASIYSGYQPHSGNAHHLFQWKFNLFKNLFQIIYSGYQPYSGKAQQLFKKGNLLKI